MILLDEPTASLDPASTLAIEGLLADARTAGRTLLLVTHDIGQARRLADRVIFLYRGRIIEDGPAAGVLRPAHDGTGPRLISSSVSSSEGRIASCCTAACSSPPSPCAASP